MGKEKPKKVQSRTLDDYVTENKEYKEKGSSNFFSAFRSKISPNSLKTTSASSATGGISPKGKSKQKAGTAAAAANIAAATSASPILTCSPSVASLKRVRSP